MQRPVAQLLVLLVTGLAVAPALATPPPTEGLVLWLDASDVDGDGRSDPDRASGQPVGTWSDRSGRANDVSQQEQGRQPTLQSGVLAGRPVLHFDGDDCLSRRDFSGLSSKDRPLHLVLVMRSALHPAHTNPRLIDIQPRGANASDPSSFDFNGLWFGYQGNGKNRIGIHFGDEGEASSVAWDQQPHLVEVVYAGSQKWLHYLDGKQDGGGTFSDKSFRGFTTELQLAVGQHFGHQAANTYFAGELAEILIYDRVLSGSEQNAVGAFLSDKYGLPTAYGPAPHFERDVLPILAQHCHTCHGAEAREADLDLRSVTAMLRGGRQGPVIVPGHPERSELMDLIVQGDMPPEGERPLERQHIALIRRWIRLGAPADEIPKETPAADLVRQQDRSHWAYQKLMRHKPPTVRATDRVRTPIDAFVLAKLERNGISLSQDAHRSTLVRRAFLDLIGLPPSPREVAEFLADQRHDAYERLIDRLLESPHFGERWGRYWLDAAGYVDVVGSDNDAAIIKPLPGKWRYRDYVIRSWNQDKPFDRFLTEQLAGDELSDWRNAPTFTQPTQEALIATGFLLCAADDTDQNELNTADIRHRVLQLTGEIVASNLLALTINCAKCHNHKYEAIPQQDYYRWMAIFAPAFNPEKWVTSNARSLADVSPAEKKVIDQHNAQLAGQIDSLKKRQQELRQRYQQKLYQQKLLRLPEPIRSDVATAIATAAEKRDEVQNYLAEKLAAAVTVSANEVSAAISQQDKQVLSDLDQQIASLQSQRKNYGTIQVVHESSPPSPTYVLRRGNHLKPAAPVEPGLLTVLSQRERAEPTAAGSPSSLLARGPTSGRRLALARQLTDAESLAGGLVARVLVNRLWQQLFGKGIVETSDNFGVSGASPTHPQLLDWLARQLVRDQWRAKPLIKLMMISSVYRQSSRRAENAAAAEKVDPGNTLLWRARLRRLDSEILRDAILTVSGKLDRSMYGPSLPLEVRPDGMVLVKSDGLPTSTSQWRRSVYVLARRNYHLSLLNTFDQPVVSTNCTQREHSAVVTQSLTLLNDTFVLQQAEFIAQRVEQLAQGSSPQQQVQSAFQIMLCRQPEQMETAWCVELLERHTSRCRQAGMPAPQAGREALAQLCHMLLSTNEFLYVH